MTGNIVNIQKYSVHDGQGIRTTIFFKGCPLRCAWCHNPETWSAAPQLMVYPERCRGCGGCASLCPLGCIGKDGVTDYTRCTGCGQCGEGCLSSAREVAGRPYTVSQLITAAQRDLPFYETSGGGVTLSGGEVMCQNPAFLSALVKGLHKKGIGVNIDTCGYAPFSAFEAVLPWVGTFLYDIKAMDNAVHRRYTGVDNALILENAKRLSGLGARLHIRIPMVAGVNDSRSEVSALLRFLSTLRVTQISLLPYHALGREKEARFGGLENGAPFEPPDGATLEAIAARLAAQGYTARIGG